MADSTILPSYDQNGLPLCSREDCPQYDGKRCRVLGFRPDRFCEPQMREDYFRIQQLEK